MLRTTPLALSTNFLRATPVALGSAALFHATPLLLLHPKKTSRRPVRTKHSVKWWKTAKPSHLTAKAIEDTPDRPSFPHFQEEVDRPFTFPADSACFNCRKPVDPDVADAGNFIWIPSGNSKRPYLFHSNCFHCSKCGFRFMNNKFYSKDNQAVCVSCALGRNPKYPTRWWHGSSNTVTMGRWASRMSGHSWPRHQHQVEFLYDPDE